MSFRVVRGRVAAEILTAATDADLLTMGKVSWAHTRHAKLGSTALAVATSAPNAVLLARPGTPSNHQVVVLYDGSVNAKQAVSIAMRFVKAESSLLVITMAETASANKRQHLVQILGMQASYQRLESTDILSLINAVKKEGCELLVLSSHNRLLEENTIKRFLNEVDCSLLLIRQQIGLRLLISECRFILQSGGNFSQ
ncbi:MAG: universal stress protein [Acidobacteriota bacterium]